MATNKLLPFANGENTNVITFSEWQALAARLTGFGSGLAVSKQFNRILAQGGAAGYVLGQFVVDYAGRDADINAEDLYQGFLAALQKLQDTLAPCGMIAFFHTTDVPDGWLLCNGALVSRTEYARLFAKIGTKYGAGDGSTTFALPNLDGRVLQGTTNTGLVGNYLEASLPNIQGTFDLRRWGESASLCNRNSGAFSRSNSGDSQQTVAIGEYSAVSQVVSFSARSSSSIYNGSRVQPKALHTLPCIKI